LTLDTEDDSKDIEDGSRMRFGVGVEGEYDDRSGFSTLTPVVFGDSGDAMMGAGMVRRFRYVGVFISAAGDCCGESAESSSQKPALGLCDCCDT